jgi:hypothetical protein
MNTNKAILYRVKPVGDITDVGGDWTLPNKDSVYYSADRKVLKVRFAFPSRGGLDNTPQDSLEDYFYIDVPKHFFSVVKSDGVGGDFIANPPYSNDDLLVVRWTGYGKYSGWIDTNVQQRGAGIAAGGGADGPGCAKWS